MLFWKGDTADVPSGSSNPEGSDMGPGHERPSVTDAADAAVFGGNANHVSEERGMRAVLLNNMYAPLVDDLDDEDLD